MPLKTVKRRQNNDKFGLDELIKKKKKKKKTFLTPSPFFLNFFKKGITLFRAQCRVLDSNKDFIQLFFFFFFFLLVWGLFSPRPWGLLLPLLLRSGDNWSECVYF